MGKWNLRGTIDFMASNFECDAKDEDEALEMLLNAGLFDHASCGYKIETFEEDEDQAFIKFCKEIRKKCN